MALSLQRKIAAVALVLYWPTLFVFAHIPIPQVVREANVSDKSLHFLGYLVLVYLFWFTVHGDVKVNWRSIAPWWILAAMALYGVFDEWSQNFVVGRTCDVRDFMADSVGIIGGLVLFSVVTFWSAGLWVTAIVIFGATNVTRADLSRLMPVPSAAFHLVAYGVFTAFWIQYIQHFSSVFGSSRRGVKWLIAAVTGPSALLLIVKVFSVIAGRVFAARDMLLSAGGIGVVVAAVYLMPLFGRSKRAIAD